MFPFIPLGSLNSYRTEDNKLKFSTNLTSSNPKKTTSIFNGNPNKRASFLPASHGGGGSSSSNSLNSQSFRDENFLKKEYELARTQVVITNNQKNLKSNHNEQDTNNNMSVPLLSNGSSNKGVIISNNKNSDEEKHELNEVRSKILGRVALKNANNMMVNGEILLNGSSEHSGDNLNDDIKFIDSDSDNLSEKRTSPLSNGGVMEASGSLNNLTGAPNHITKMLAASTPVNSNSTTMTTRNTTNNTTTVTLNKTNTYPPKPTKTNTHTPNTSVVISPSNKKLILNASPKNSCVYEKQQQNRNLLQKLSINNSETAAAAGKMDATKTVTLSAGNRLRIITSHDTDDDDDFTNVSTTATIILPSKAKQNGVAKNAVVGGETIVANNHDSSHTKVDCSDASTINLEKKNFANHKQIQSDTNDSSVSSPILIVFFLSYLHSASIFSYILYYKLLLFYTLFHYLMGRNFDSLDETNLIRRLHQLDRQFLQIRTKKGEIFVKVEKLIGKVWKLFGKSGKSLEKLINFSRKHRKSMEIVRNKRKIVRKAKKFWEKLVNLLKSQENLQKSRKIIEF